MQEGDKEGVQGEGGSRVRESETADVQGSKWMGREREERRSGAGTQFFPS